MFAIRRSKQDVGGLIPETTVERSAELTPYQKHLVDELKVVAAKLKTGEIESGKIDELTMLNEIKQTFVRIRQIANNPAILGGRDESDNYDLLVDILNEILSDDSERVIVFTEFKEAVNLLSTRLSRFSPIVIDDSITNKEEAIKKFENRSLNHKIMISTPYRIGVGCSFSNTSYMVYVDKPMSGIVYKQSRERIIRRDSTGTLATFINLYSTYNDKKFVDHTVDKILLKKEKTHDAFMESADFIQTKYDIEEIIELLQGIFNEIKDDYSKSWTSN